MTDSRDYRILSWGVGKQDGSRMIVVWETPACLLQEGEGGSGVCPPPRKILNLDTSQIASDAIWDKISEHFDDTYLRSVTCKWLI